MLESSPLWKCLEFLRMPSPSVIALRRDRRLDSRSVQPAARSSPRLIDAMAWIWFDENIYACAEHPLRPTWGSLRSITRDFDPNGRIRPTMMLVY